MSTKLKSVRRMFRATSGYVLSLVPQNVDAARMNGSGRVVFYREVGPSTFVLVRSYVKELRRSHIKSFCHAADVCKML